MQRKPRLLDLFSGAGGAAMGYSRAGFEVVGVDIKPQPHYPFEFIQADVFEHLKWRFDRNLGLQFDAIHASPPCQAYSPLRNMWNKRGHPDLIGPTRERLRQIGLPYVIENVPGAASQLRNPVTLCGSQFHLGCDKAELRRHRLFESNTDLFAMLPPCQHGWKNQTIAVYGHAGGYSRRTRERAAVIGVYGGHGRDRRRSSPQQFATDARREAMGIEWMTGTELSQAIPPAYTEWIGTHLLNAIKAAA